MDAPLLLLLLLLRRHSCSISVETCAASKGSSGPNTQRITTPGGRWLCTAGNRIMTMALSLEPRIHGNDDDLPFEIMPLSHGNSPLIYTVRVETKTGG
ncbi:hypothetical protein B0T19DRAFT_406674 [Cercophora scortea]|uniref:Secreted protein n=1 Tax=Cercophora scortea TaxID=314031 RepID=A0AAE0J244_9PEZI|nr:hypothetical protein B0T19DRAFT_406674 [Cercophora scortea]